GNKPGRLCITLQEVIRLERDARPFEAQPLRAQPVYPGQYLTQEGFLRNFYVTIGFQRRLGLVTGIREQERSVRGQQERSVTAREPRQVPHIRERRNEKCVDFQIPK